MYQSPTGTNTFEKSSGQFGVRRVVDACAVHAPRTSSRHAKARPRMIIDVVAVGTPIKNFDLVCYQDEQIKTWTRKHGKVIQHSILGRVKVLLEGQDNTFKLSKWLPTSKFCFDCFSKHDNLQLWDREFACPNCGCVSDRDVHAAQNMIYFALVVKGIESLIAQNKVPTEYREPRNLVEALLAFGKRVETSSSVENLISDFLQELSLRHEAPPLRSG